MTPARLAVGVVIGTLVCCALAGSARASVPPGFFGVVPQGPIEQADYARMAQAEVGTLRFQLSWALANPAPGVYDWTASDAIVGGAASARDPPTPLPVRNAGVGGDPRRSCLRIRVRSLCAGRPRRPRSVARLRRGRRPPLRAGRRVLGAPSGASSPADPRVADLERAELIDILQASTEPTAVCGAAGPCPRRDHRGPSPGANRARWDVRAPPQWPTRLDPRLALSLPPLPPRRRGGLRRGGGAPLCPYPLRRVFPDRPPPGSHAERRRRPDTPLGDGAGLGLKRRCERPQRRSPRPGAAICVTRSSAYWPSAASFGSPTSTGTRGAIERRPPTVSACGVRGRASSTRASNRSPRWRPSPRSPAADDG